MKQPNLASRHQARRWSRVACEVLTKVDSAWRMAWASRSEDWADKRKTNAQARIRNGRGPALHFRSVIAFADMNDEILPAFHPDFDGLQEAIGFEGLGLVGDVVLMAQFVGDVLE